MTDEDVIEQLEAIKFLIPRNRYKAINYAIKALKNQDEDCISRKKVLKQIEESVTKYSGQYTADMLNMWGLFSQMIKDIPSAIPKIKGEYVTIAGRCLYMVKGDQLESDKWDKLYRWLNDMRLGFMPDKNIDINERIINMVQVDILDIVLDQMNKLEKEG